MRPRGTRAHGAGDAVQLGREVAEPVLLLLGALPGRDLEERPLLAHEPFDAGEQAEVGRDLGPVVGSLDVGRTADPSTGLDGGNGRPNAYGVMPTRIVFHDGLEITVPESEDDVVLAIRRDHPNPVRLRADGSRYVNWDHIRLIGAAEDAARELGIELDASTLEDRELFERLSLPGAPAGARGG